MARTLILWSREDEVLNWSNFWETGDGSSRHIMSHLILLRNGECCVKNLHLHLTAVKILKYLCCNAFKKHLLSFMTSKLSWPRGKNDRFTGSGLGKWFSTLGIEWWINIVSSSCVLCYSNLFQVATILFSVLTLSSGDVIKNGEADVGFKVLFWPFWHQWDFLFGEENVFSSIVGWKFVCGCGPFVFCVCF